MVNPEILKDQHSRVVDEINKRFADKNLQHPQHQSVGKSEVLSMVGDETTAYTEVVDDLNPELTIFVPHLAQIRHFEWLNSDFYNRKFPDINHNEIMNYIDIPGIEPGPQVLEKIRLLAANNGVLVFETSSCDEGTLERIMNLIKVTGVEHTEAELLGTQTYFAGQALLLTVEPSETPLTLGETYDRTDVEKLGMYDPTTKTGVVLEHRVTEETARYMYDFYDKAYEVLNDHPCRQGLSPDEFYEMAVNDEDVDKLIYYKNGIPEALYLVCTDLSKLTWVNEQFYQKKYPNQYNRRQLTWFPGIATDPRPEVAGHNTKFMIDLMAKLVVQGRNDFLALMDFCDMNAEWLPGYLESEINKTKEARISILPIATQQYWAVQLKSAA